MSESSFSINPILNSPYEYPGRHWEMDGDNRPTEKILEFRRPSSLKSPIAVAKHIGDCNQGDLFAIEDKGVDYATNDFINSIRAKVDEWRRLPQEKWNVTPETARLLRHWRNGDNFPDIRPFFCQVEAVETLIWLVEVANSTVAGKSFLEKIAIANANADPLLYRIALKLATGAGKTTVMAMIIAWQTINAVRHGVSDKFTNGFLITTPGITIKDRLRVLFPNDTESYYEHRNLVPKDMLQLVESARIVITNYHAFQRKSVMELSSGTKAMLVGPTGEGGPQMVETAGQMISRVLGDAAGLKNILMINDEAHHCYRQRPQDAEAEEEGAIESELKDEAKKNEEAARLWISGLEAIRNKMPKAKVVDLSATPFFLSGSGYKEGTLFPWTVCDFSLMDALECGIVKLPRIPVDDNDVTIEELPKYRELWKHLKKDKIGKAFCAIKGKAKADAYNPKNIPNLLRAAIEVLYSGYKRVFSDWENAGCKMPPCFIIVCQNTAISKIVYRYISGYDVEDKDGAVHHEKGACPLFDNFDEEDQPLSRPRTLLIDSTQLEAGESLSDEFRNAASEEIEIFKRELRNRGEMQKAEKLTDEDVLREVMNTVGKPGKLGESIRCVVSVSMLTEGWDANTVTHILGIRAFGTQLLCEQVVGRGLRRLNYEADNVTGLFTPEYSDIFGIPFHFASGVKNPPPILPPDIVHVHAVNPEREYLKIRFPRVLGYYLELEKGHLVLDAKFTESSILEISQGETGPTIVRIKGVVGESNILKYEGGHRRRSDVIMHLSKRFIEKFYSTNQYATMDRIHLFGQVKRLFTEWIEDGYLRCYNVPEEVVVEFPNLCDEACNRVNDAIVRAATDDDKMSVSVLLDDFLPTGSTSVVNFRISRNKKILHETRETSSHVNYAVCDSKWETIMCRILEECDTTIAYVKNYGLGFEVPYVIGNEQRQYQPDFIVLVDDGHGPEDPLHLVLEVKGYRYIDANAKKSTMETYWIPGVNKLKTYGRWVFLELNKDHFELDGFSSDDALLENCRKAYAESINSLMNKGKA
ncbi:MAG: restriction endonuclease [Lentisphaerae bacterium]|nr:restriction endonuclease [Lentisphaerota bacterium]